MMAFFLLMWVLGSTTAGDLAGISSYFQNPLRVSLSGGQGSGDATRIIKGGGDNITKTVGEESRADADTVDIAADDAAEPDVAERADMDIADDDGARRDPCIRVDGGEDAAIWHDDGTGMGEHGLESSHIAAAQKLKS
jgi:chemotaxis protein MotB